MAFLQKRSKKKRHEADFGRKVRCARNSKFAIQCFMTSAFDWKTLNFSSRVHSYIDGGLDKDLVDLDSGENIAGKRRNLGINAGDSAAVSDEFMFPPPTALWKAIANGRTILLEFRLANMMNYFVTRKVCDGEIAGDFKYVNNHIQLDVIIVDTILCRFSICCFGEYIWNLLLFLDLDRFTIFRGLPEFFLLNEAKLS